MALTAKEYYDHIWATGGEIDNASPPDPAIQSSAHAARLIQFGQKFDSLQSMLANASLDNADSDHRSWALGRLVEDFSKGVTTHERKVELPKDLVEQHGGDVQAIKFGVQEIQSSEQRDKLAADVERARKYFSGIELHTVIDKKGNELALVVGVDARDFNAVIKAEYTRDAYARERDRARDGMARELAPSMTVEKAPIPEFAVRMDNVEALFPKKEAEAPAPHHTEQADVSPLATPGQEKSGVKQVA